MAIPSRDRRLQAEESSSNDSDDNARYDSPYSASESDFPSSDDSDTCSDRYKIKKNRF